MEESDTGAYVEYSDFFDLQRERNQLETVLRSVIGVLSNVEESLEESRDYPLTLKDVREAMDNIMEVVK